MFKNKKKILEQNKVEFIEGDPIWGIKGIPDPTWKDLKWSTSLATKGPHAIYDAAVREGRIWRLAKYLDYRRKHPGVRFFRLENPIRFNDGSVSISQRIAAPNEANFQDVKVRAKMLRMILSQQGEICNATTVVKRVFQRREWEILAILFEYNALPREQKEYALKKLLLEKEGDVYEMLLPWCGDVDVTALTESLKKAEGVLKNTEDTPPDETGGWEKLSDMKVFHTRFCGDGSSLKRIFDFAVGRVQVIERDKTGIPATFEYEFDKVGSEEIAEAREELKKRGGAPDNKTAKRHLAKPAVLLGSHGAGHE